ncbi:MAG: T9SS type A sorting domain-containing protein [Saprospiraceae bacterium]|nr:T9SS type A sorting domain-containing protein [Saprospiraceae bacterium]
MYSLESRAQEPPCLCPDPDFNVVIDPVIFPNGATLTQLQGAFTFFQGNTMTNNCLSIQGRLIIDKNFEIIGGEVIMQPGSLHTWGELVLLNAVTSPQKWQGNQWLGVDVNDPSSFGANYVGDILMAPLSKFTTHTNMLPYHPQHVLVNNSFQAPTDWFDDDDSQDFYQCDPMAPEEGNSDDAISIFAMYAEGGFELAGYGKGAQWMAERHLYRNLKATPALLSGAILPQFYSDAASGPIGAFYDIEQGIGTLGQIPDSVKTLLETLYEDEQTYTEAWEDVELLIANADSLQLPALEQERQDIEDDLEEVALAIAQILEDVEADRLAQIQDLQTDNAAITPANNPGHYLKSVNEIYLDHAADHSEWTMAERLTLDSIALLCPSEGGDAVYIARAMLGQLHGDDCVELPAAFQAPVPPVHTTLEEPVAGIYPNPGHNEFFLNVPVTQSGQAELRLYSLTGKQVHRVILPAETRSELNLSVLPGGLYLYEVWGDGMRLMNGKLSKISQ